MTLCQFFEMAPATRQFFCFWFCFWWLRSIRKATSIPNFSDIFTIYCWDITTSGLPNFIIWTTHSVVMTS